MWIHSLTSLTYTGKKFSTKRSTHQECCEEIMAKVSGFDWLNLEHSNWWVGGLVLISLLRSTLQCAPYPTNIYLWNMPRIFQLWFSHLFSRFLVNSLFWEGFPEIIFNPCIVRVGYTLCTTCDVFGLSFFWIQASQHLKTVFLQSLQRSTAKQYMTYIYTYLHIVHIIYIYTYYTHCINIYHIYHKYNTYSIYILYIIVFYVCVLNPLTTLPKKSIKIHTPTQETPESSHNFPAVSWVTPTRWDSLWHILRCLETLKVEIFRKDTMKVGSIPSILSNIDHTNHLYN